MDFSHLSDAQLYQLCKQYGVNARMWLRKFAGLLPEVQRRQLHQKRGYASIYEFAKKLGGMTENGVDRIFQLHDRLKDKPALLQMLVNGEEGWSKLEVVSFIANSATDIEWAERVKNLSQQDLKIFVDKMRRTASKSIVNDELQHISKWLKLTFPVSPELRQMLQIYKEKLQQEKGRVFTWDQAFKELLAGTQLFQKKTVAQVCPGCIQRREVQRKQVSRHIPEDVKQLVLARTQGLCAFSNCGHVIENFHHTKRFALERNHDPRYIVGLCKKHHSFAHSGLIENEENSPKDWKIRQKPDKTTSKYWIDTYVRLFKRPIFKGSIS